MRHFDTPIHLFLLFIKKNCESSLCVGLLVCGGSDFFVLEKGRFALNVRVYKKEVLHSYGISGLVSTFKKLHQFIHGFPYMKGLRIFCLLFMR